MSKKTSYKLLDKSLASALTAIEIYNKPNILYREETFSILMINAYELLFKSKIVEDSKSIKSIYVYEKKKLANDTSSKREYIKRNRINEPYTKDINKLMNVLKSQKKISQNIFENVQLLIEIRDNAVHFLNDTAKLKYKLYTICVATVKNYYRLIEKWFHAFDISNYDFFITPINFSGIEEEIDPLTLEISQKNFLNYLDMATSAADAKDEFDICIKTELKFIKVETDETLLIKYAEEGRKIDVEINDELFKKMYPYDYGEILVKIKNKYPQIKANNEFNIAKKKLQEEEVCCKARYLDPNKKGVSRFYYNSNFVKKINDELAKN